jgi:hypothetical protein
LLWCFGFGSLEFGFGLGKSEKKCHLTIFIASQEKGGGDLEPFYQTKKPQNLRTFV